MFVFLEFAFWCKVSAVAPDHSPAKAGLLRAKVQQGCRHPVSPTLLLGGQRQRRSVVASKGLNVGNGGKTAVASYSHWQARSALNPLLLWEQTDLLINALYFSVQLWRCSYFQHHWNSGPSPEPALLGVLSSAVCVDASVQWWGAPLACEEKGEKPVGRTDMCQRGTGK